jgi:hypothetical protein
MNANTTTTRYECPEGHIFVKIAQIDGKLWINATIGHTGSQTMANARAISALAGIAIRHGAPPVKIASALKGTTHETSNHLMARTNGDVALSMADAIGKEIERVLVD